MSSKPRIIGPNLIYQITSQGIHEIQMFVNDEFKLFFLDQLHKTLIKYCFTCLSFCITKNQYHIAIRSGEQSISKAMQRLNSVLSKKFNRLTGRNGVAFKTRFRSLIVEDGELVKDLIRFIHLEPVIQKECSIKDLDNYKWCSHSMLIGNCMNDFIQTEEVLRFFNRPDFPKEYLEYIHNGINDYQNDEVVKEIKDANLGKTGFKKPELWIIGKPEFIQETLKNDKCRRAQIARYKKENVTFQIIHQSVTSLLDLDNMALLKQGKLNVRSTARELFVYTAKYRYDYSGVQLADYMKITGSAVSKMIARFSGINNTNYLLKRVIEQITQAR